MCVVQHESWALHAQQSLLRMQCAVRFIKQQQRSLRCGPCACSQIHVRLRVFVVQCHAGWVLIASDCQPQEIPMVYRRLSGSLSKSGDRVAVHVMHLLLPCTNTAGRHLPHITCCYAIPARQAACCMHVPVALLYHVVCQSGP